jgi:hypothetical protein
MPKAKKVKPKTPLKLLQGGKTKESKEAKVHPFANFMGKNTNASVPKPHTHQQTLHPQIPRKKAV